jgi:hypothetical protein
MTIADHASGGDMGTSVTVSESDYVPGYARRSRRGADSTASDTGESDIASAGFERDVDGGSAAELGDERADDESPVFGSLAATLVLDDDTRRRETDGAADARDADRTAATESAADADHTDHTDHDDTHDARGGDARDAAPSTTDDGGGDRANSASHDDADDRDANDADDEADDDDAADDDEADDAQAWDATDESDLDDSRNAGQPFWVLAGTERDVHDEHGQPVFRIGPTAWVLVIEDRDGAYVVRHDDGRIGYLHDISDTTKG